MNHEKLDILCQKYAMRVGNEIGWMSKVIKHGYDYLNHSANSTYKKQMLSLNNQALLASQKMQIVYLVNLFESFMQDYITIKGGLSEMDLNQNDFRGTHLNSEISKWNQAYKTNKEAYSNSTSFMNIRFSLFVLNEKYGLSYPSYLSNTIPELGSLRNCLVHCDGDITSKDKGGHTFRETLVETLKYLEIGKREVKLISLDKNDFINKVVFDFQTFIELCGGRITRPDDHKKYIASIK